MAYSERVQDIKHGLFTPIAMSATGGMARECIKFYSPLSKMIAEKRHQPYSVIAPCIVDQWHCQTIYSRQQQTMLLQVKRYPILFQSEYMSIPPFFLPFFVLEVCDWENILVNLWFFHQEEKHPTGWKKCLKKTNPFCHSNWSFRLLVEGFLKIESQLQTTKNG